MAAEFALMDRLDSSETSDLTSRSILFGWSSDMPSPDGIIAFGVLSVAVEAADRPNPAGAFLKAGGTATGTARIDLFDSSDSSDVVSFGGNGLSLLDS